MSSSKKYSIGIRVEGIGDDTAKSEGAVWYWGAKLSASQKSASNYDWIGDFGSREGLTQPPKSVASTVDPFTADLRTSSYTFELHYSDLTATSFFATQANAQYALNATLDIGDTTVSLVQRTSRVSDSGLLDSSNDGEVVWIGQEAVRLGTFDTVNRFTGSTRAYWGTTEERHFSGEHVYQRNPLVQHRQVQLIRFDHADDSESIIWRGFIEGEVRTSTDGTRAIIRVNEILSVIQNARVNRETENLALHTTGAFSDVSVRVHEGKVKGAVPPPAGGGVRGKTTSADWSAFQIDDGLVFAEWNQNRANAYDFADSRDGDGSIPTLGSPLPENAEPESIYEVLAVDRTGDGVAGISKRSSTSDLTNEYHPIAIIMALYRSTSSSTLDASTWDVFGWNWGLGAPADWFDDSDITALIEETEFLEIDQLVLGWDGEEVEPWQLTKQLCRTYGFYPSMTNAGQLTFSAFRDVTVQEVCNSTSVTPIPYELELLQSRADSVDVISGVYGALPWDDGERFVIRQTTDDGSGRTVVRSSLRPSRQALFAQDREQTFDMPTRKSVQDMSTTLISMSIARSWAAPRLRIRVNDGDYSHGDYVRLASPGLEDNWFIDTNGNRVAIDTESSEWVGLVVGHKRNLEDDTVNLELLLTNHSNDTYARLRAPSGEVASYSSSGTVTVTLNNEFTSDDASTFSVGDKVEVWAPAGFRRSGTSGSPDVVEVTATPNTTASAGTIELDAAFSTDPKADDIIRLAHLDDVDGYPEEGHTGVQAAPCALAFTWLCDDNGQLGPNSIDGHVYGYGQI